MKKHRKLFAGLLAVLLLSGCAQVGPGETTPAETPPAATEPTTEPTTAPTTVPTTAPTETTEAPTEPTEPPYESTFTREDIDFFTDLLGNGMDGMNYYNRLLASEFAAPEDADVRKIFYDQDSDEDHPLTDAETEFLGKQEVIALQLSVVRISGEKMDAVLTELLGLTLAEMTGNGMDRMVYFEETGCYYHSHGDYGAVGFKILGGNRFEDGTVEILYRKTYGLGNRIITLRETDGGYHVLSNLQQTA